MAFVNASKSKQNDQQAAQDHRSVSEYQDTAYNSQSFAPQRSRQEKGFLRRMMTSGKPFSFSETTDSITVYGLDKITPSEMAKIAAINQQEVYWDEQSLNGEGLTGWSQVYAIMVSITNGCLFMVLPLAYILFLSGLLFGEGEIVFVWNDGMSDLFWGLTLYATLPCLLIYIHYKLLHAGYMFLAPFLRPSRIFELNRTTGMVTLFKKNKPFFTHLFIEFDCVLMSSPTQQGFLNYSLTLIHRYQDYSVGVPISGSMGANHKVIEYHRFWNMVQRYMDISQPLPDILVLEPARQRDPTTIAYDKEHNRNPRYWRDMTDDEFAKKMDEIEKAQKNTPATGKSINIFEAPNAIVSKKHSNKKK
ncbi:hypothetical protein [Marinomonas primoryensis]|uniref:Putative transmembrane protein n=1 Tax=Marinomonas primoryensis TaxID=178399 RepID=A0A859CZS2_9GAMM|nr:hypothetical protein [Marinomonas primoryensis]QKK79849.1 putative transmembrane protein [Marinomonas primoryensis]